MIVTIAMSNGILSV